MTLARDLRLLSWRTLLGALRTPVWIGVGLSTPLLYLVLFAPLLKPLAGSPGFPSGSVLDTFLPGILCLMAFGAGTGAGWLVIFERDSGVLERLRVTPASRFALLMGNVVRDVALMAAPALLVIVLALPLGYHPAWSGVAPLLLLLALVTSSTSALSCALGLTLGEIGSLAAVVTGATLPLTLLSGILLPLSLAPGWLRLIAKLNPLAYAVDGARALSAGELGSGDVVRAFLVLGTVTLAALAWATRAYRRSAG